MNERWNLVLANLYMCYASVMFDLTVSIQFGVGHVSHASHVTAAVAANKQIRILYTIDNAAE